MTFLGQDATQVVDAVEAEVVKALVGMLANSIGGALTEQGITNETEVTKGGYVEGVEVGGGAEAGAGVASGEKKKKGLCGCFGG